MKFSTKTLGLILLAITGYFQSFALTGSDFTIRRISAPYFIIDGNVPATINQCYVGFEVVNTSATVTYKKLVFSVTSLTTSVAGQNYSLLYPTSGTINVGTLAPGESKTCYYYVSYPASSNADTSLTAHGIFNVRLSDTTASNKTQTFLIYNRRSISANAGGLSASAISTQDLLGGIIRDTVTYTVGNVQNGDENDFQVTGNNLFDPTKLALIQTKVVQSSVPQINVGATDSLYFISGNGSVGATVRIVWTFRIISYNFTTYLLPCAGATSGSTNYKYQLNTSLGSGDVVTVSAAANPLTITKTSDKVAYCSTNDATATFTVTISNPGIYPVTVEKINDTLPTGFTFVSVTAASDITLVNSVLIPAAGTTGAISFEGGISSGVNTSYTVPAGGNIRLIYTATVPAGTMINLSTKASDYIGATKVGTATNTISVGCSLAVTISSFTAVKENDHTVLSWTTANESNTKNFIVQHSTDGINWTNIATLQAAGISTTNKNYTYTHINPVTGNNYYRLLQNNTDGTFSYSDSKRIWLQNNSKIFSIVSNPVSNGMVQLNIAAKTTLFFYTAAGKLLLQKHFSPGLQSVAAGQFARGMYIIKGAGQQEKLLIQ